MRIKLTVLYAAILITACGRVPGGAPAAVDYKLYEATGDRQIAVIDSRSHATERKLPLGTPSADWNHLYSVSGRTLTDTDPVTGDVIQTLGLPGDYRLPPATLSGVPGGLSSNGRWLVLESFDSTTAYQLPSASHFALVETPLGPAAIRIDLKGYFGFDAVTNDGSRVYLIEYVSVSSYRVRIYQVAARRLDPQIVVDKTDPRDSMTGLRLSGIPSHDGSWLYSIYVRQGDAPFIHALNLDGSPIAFCIDLAGVGFGTNEDAFHWSLAMSTDGSHLYASNAAMGVVSDISIGTGAPPHLARTAHIDTRPPSAGLIAQDVQAKEFGANASVISRDGTVLVTAASSGIVWIGTTGLRASATALRGWNVWSLALSPDGTVLFALSDTGQIAEISMGSSEVRTTFESGDRYPLDLTRVAAA